MAWYAIFVFLEHDHEQATHTENRVDYQPWDGIAGMPLVAMSILQRL